MVESPIYAKVEYENAVSVKKDILASEIQLLNSVKNIKEYKRLKKQKTILKIKLKKLISTVKKDLREISNSTPKVKSVEEQKTEKPVEKKQKRGRHTVEDELAQIQEELKALS